MALSQFTPLLFIILLLSGAALADGQKGKNTKADPPQPASVEAVYGIISRLLGPELTGNFTLCVLDDKVDNDTFEVRPSPAGLIEICGTTGVAMAKGLYWYLQTYCNASVTWGNHGTGDQLGVPKPLPAVKSAVRVTSTVKWRYYMNVCTVSYSSAWWTWRRWQREIDWMALHGINLPLAFTGQEYVLAEFYKQLGLTEKELDHYFSGPAFLAWNRMGNIRGWAGPLSPDWRYGQYYLQLQSLELMRSLGMTPVLSGFSGHVPAALSRIFPNITLTPSAPWGNFNETYTQVPLLDPTDPHFVALAKGYYDIQTKLMGTDHIYNVDTFNEMSPKTSDAAYLANCSEAVYKGIRASDPDGIWLMQGWLFESGFWKAPSVSAYLGGVPNDGMIILDLFTEAAPIWSRYESYYGKPFIWCMLHNFGGRRALGGDLTRIATGPVQDRVAAGSTMNGIGITMEAIEQNPIMYELMLEMGWHSTAVDVDSWVQKYAANRYGFTNSLVSETWTTLVSAVYQFHYGGAFFGSLHQSPQIPSIKIDHFDIESVYPTPTEPFISGYLQQTTKQRNLSKIGDLGYDLTGVVSAWRTLFAAASAVTDELPGPLSYDLVDVGRQVLVDMHSDLVTQLNAAYVRAVRDKVDSRSEIQAVGTALEGIIKDLDMLLATDPNYLLGHWISTAREWGSTDLEKSQYEANARYQVTLWGPDGQINDYAEKHWAGLVGDYYFNRWKLLIDTLTTAAAAQKPADAGAYSSALLHQEQTWCQNNNPFSPEPVGNVVQVTKTLMTRWASSNTTYQKTTNMTVQNNDLQFGSPMHTLDIEQLKVLCDINPKCAGFTTMGYLKNASTPLIKTPGYDMYLKAPHHS